MNKFKETSSPFKATSIYGGTVVPTNTSFISHDEEIEFNEFINVFV